MMDHPQARATNAILFSQRSVAQILQRFFEMKQEIARLQAASAADLAEILRRRSYEPDYPDAISFVCGLLGVSKSEARHRVREAHALSRRQE